MKFSNIFLILFWKPLQFVPLKLSNKKKLKRAKIVIFTISSFLSAKHLLITTSGQFSEKRRSDFSIADFYISFYIDRLSLKNRQNLLFLKKLQLYKSKFTKTCLS